LARIFHVDGDPGQILHHDLAGKPRMPAGTAGSDDDFLECKERAFQRLNGARENRIALDVAANGFTNGVRLLVNLTQHRVREVALRREFRGLRVAWHPLPASGSGGLSGGAALRDWRRRGLNVPT